MIGKVLRGERVAGLLRYLYSESPAQQEGRNRRNPHTDPRVVGGFDEPSVLEPGVGERGRRDLRRLMSVCWSSRWRRPGWGRRSGRCITW